MILSLIRAVAFRPWLTLVNLILFGVVYWS